MQFSNLGIEDDYFLQCLNTYLHSLVNMLKDDNEAYHMIERMNTCLPRKALQEADVNVVQDPFFRSILMAFFRYCSTKLLFLSFWKMMTLYIFAKFPKPSAYFAAGLIV